LEEEMKREHKVWWLGMADWFEAYAEADDARTPTCILLTDWPNAEPKGFGFYREQVSPNWDANAAWTHLKKVWMHWPKRDRSEMDYPCGDFELPYHEVEEKRREYCLWMADAIREAVEEGIYPWEDK
jgi:hypothetical protein